MSVSILGRAARPIESWRRIVRSDRSDDRLDRTAAAPAAADEQAERTQGGYSMRTRNDRGPVRRLLVAATACGLMLAACGGDDDDDGLRLGGHARRRGDRPRRHRGADRDERRRRPRRQRHRRDRGDRAPRRRRARAGGTEAPVDDREVDPNGVVTFTLRRPLRHDGSGQGGQPVRPRLHAPGLRHADGARPRTARSSPAWRRSGSSRTTRSSSRCARACRSTTARRSTPTP